MSKRDRQVQGLMARTARGVNRRSFLSRAAGGTAGAVAAVVIGPVSGRDNALAHSGYPCYPPCGRYCSGCYSNADCPSGYTTCTNASQSGSLSSCCPYSSGYWYSGPSGGDQHRCRDCKTLYGPWTCNNCAGICGCRSTIHY